MRGQDKQSGRNQSLMSTKTLFTTLLMLALVTAGRAQTLDKAKAS
jgi:hypothetical protein